jgi:hypothetical protein
MDPLKCESLLSDTNFFEKYQKSKDSLDKQMVLWEDIQSHLENLMKQR